MKRGEVFVRARDLLGEEGLADVLDLDDESFRLWVMARLAGAGQMDYSGEGVYYVRYDASLRKWAGS